MLSGLTVGGNHGCPPCGSDGLQTQGRSKFLNKVIYMGARRFLPIDHRFRTPRYDKLFGDQPETRLAPRRPTGRFWEAQWNRVQANEIPLKRSGMVTLSAFYRLPYFKVNCTKLLY